MPKDYCLASIWISESGNLGTLNINWNSVKNIIILFENSVHVDSEKVLLLIFRIIQLFVWNEYTYILMNYANTHASMIKTIHARDLIQLIFQDIGQRLLYDNFDFISSIKHRNICILMNYISIILKWNNRLCKKKIKQVVINIHCIFEEKLSYIWNWIWKTLVHFKLKGYIYREVQQLKKKPAEKWTREFKADPSSGTKHF